MIAAVEEQLPARAALVRRARRAVLGLDKLQLADQYAPVGSDRRVEWREAVAIVDDTLARVLARASSDIFRTCLDRGHVDAEPRPGKVGGAYCSSISKTRPPVRPHELHRPAARRDHARARVRPRRARDARARAPAVPRVPHGPRAGRGAVDVHAAPRRRAAASSRRTTRRRARCCSPTAPRARWRRSSARR